MIGASVIVASSLCGVSRSRKRAHLPIFQQEIRPASPFGEPLDRAIDGWRFEQIESHDLTTGVVPDGSAMLSGENHSGRLADRFDELRDADVAMIAFAAWERSIPHREPDGIDAHENNGGDRGDADGPASVVGDANQHGSCADAERWPTWQQESEKPPCVVWRVNQIERPDNHDESAEKAAHPVVETESAKLFGTAFRA